MKVLVNVELFESKEVQYKGKGYLYPSGLIKIVATIDGETRRFEIDPDHYGKDKRRLMEKTTDGYTWSNLYLMSMEVDKRQAKILGGVYKAR
jgi:hypothetical protein